MIVKIIIEIGIIRRQGIVLYLKNQRVPFHYQKRSAFSFLKPNTNLDHNQTNWIKKCGGMDLYTSFYQFRRTSGPGNHLVQNI